MPSRFRVAMVGATVRVVDCADHEPDVAPDMCTVGLLLDPRDPDVRSRAAVIAAALNAQAAMG